MSDRIGRLRHLNVVVLVVVALFLAPCLGAPVPQASMTLTSAGSNVMGSVYVNPYYASINNSVPIQVICDDYADESYVGETWTANITSLSNVVGSEVVKWKNGGYFYQSDGTYSSLGEQAAYDEAAWLSLQLLSETDPLKRGEISYALWAVFDPQALTDLKKVSSVYLAEALNYLGQAQSNYGSGDYSNFYIYTPVSGGPPQEFLVVRTPEPSAMMVLGADLLALVGVILFVRRRTGQAAV